MGLESTYRLKLRPDLPYMTPGEMSHFKKLCDGGAISIFRVSACEGCGADIPKSGTKTHCSKRCHEEQYGSEKSAKMDG